MATAEVVKISVIVNSGAIQDYTHLDDHIPLTYDMSPGCKPFTMLFFWQGSWLWHEFWVEFVSVYSKRLSSACQGILFRIVVVQKCPCLFTIDTEIFGAQACPANLLPLKKRWCLSYWVSAGENKVGLSGALFYELNVQRNLFRCGLGCLNFLSG